MQPSTTNPEHDSIHVIFSALDLTTNRDSPRKILPVRRPRIPSIPCVVDEGQSGGGTDTSSARSAYKDTNIETESPSMDKLTRLKDSVLRYLSPKRQRTTDPATLTADNDNNPGFIQDTTDSNINRQDFVGNVGQIHRSPSERNERKRARSEDEDEDEIVIGSIDEGSIIPSHEEEIGTTSDGESEVIEAGSDVEMRSASDGEAELIEAGSEVEMGSEGSGGGRDSDEEEEEEEEEKEGAELDSDREGIEAGSDVEMGSEGSGEEEEEDGAELGWDEEGIKGEEEGEEEGEEDDDDEEYTDFREVARTKVSAYLAQHHPLTEQKTSIARLQAEGNWHPEALYVYERIQMRGYEPIIPLDWKMDFPNLPRDLFTSAEDNDSSCISDYNLWQGQSLEGHGWRYLEKLIQLGMTVYCKQGQRPGQIERCVDMTLARAIKWTEKDGGYHEKRFIPTIVVHKAKPKHSMEIISTCTFEKMTALGKRHRERLAITEDEHGNFNLDPNKRTPPLIYGIIIAKSKLVFMTHDSSIPKAEVRYLHDLDLLDVDGRVWNGIAIMIFICTSRKYNMEIRDEYETNDDPVPVPAGDEDD